MPNWCANRVVISGNPTILEVMTKLLTDLDGSNLLQLCVPMPPRLKLVHYGSRFVPADGSKVPEGILQKPDWIRVNEWFCEDGQVWAGTEELVQLRDEHGHANWYDWSTVNWGTKWDVSFTLGVCRDDNQTIENIELRFNSAWGPPLAPMKILATRYGVELRHDYVEPGMGFAGRLTVTSDGNAELQEIEFPDEIALVQNNEFFLSEVEDYFGGEE
jgi:hypothetical protein